MKHGIVNLLVNLENVYRSLYSSFVLNKRRKKDEQKYKLFSQGVMESTKKNLKPLLNSSMLNYCYQNVPMNPDTCIEFIYKFLETINLEATDLFDYMLNNNKILEINYNNSYFFGEEGETGRIEHMPINTFNGMCSLVHEIGHAYYHMLRGNTCSNAYENFKCEISSHVFQYFFYSFLLEKNMYVDCVYDEIIQEYNRFIEYLNDIYSNNNYPYEKLTYVLGKLNAFRLLFDYGSSINVKDYLEYIKNASTYDLVSFSEDDYKNVCSLVKNLENAKGFKIADDYNLPEQFINKLNSGYFDDVDPFSSINHL